MSEEVPQDRPDFPSDEALRLGRKCCANILNDLRSHVIDNTFFLGNEQRAGRFKRAASPSKGSLQCEKCMLAVSLEPLGIMFSLL